MKRSLAFSRVGLILATSLLVPLTAYCLSTAGLPPEFRSLAVRPIANDTLVPSTENLRLAISDRLVNGGRVAVEPDERKADGVLVVSLRYYRNAPFGSGTNLVANQYQMWIVVSAALLDRKSGQTLWEEEGFQRKFLYKPVGESDGLTEEGAQDRMWQAFAQDIIKRTLEGPSGIESLSSRSLPRLPASGR